MAARLYLLKNDETFGILIKSATWAGIYFCKPLFQSLLFMGSMQAYNKNY